MKINIYIEVHIVIMYNMKSLIDIILHTFIHLHCILIVIKKIRHLHQYICIHMTFEIVISNVLNIPLRLLGTIYDKYKLHDDLRKSMWLLRVLDY